VYDSFDISCSESKVSAAVAILTRAILGTRCRLSIFRERLITLVNSFYTGMEVMVRLITPLSKNQAAASGYAVAASSLLAVCRVP